MIHNSVDMITVFRAQAIITMEPSLPIATAVAVRNGVILSVGSWEAMQPWLAGNTYIINDDFQQCVLMPGFIDTHVHPLLGALICSSELLTPFSWDLPWQTTTALTTPQAYRDALAAWIHKNLSSTAPLLTWGYHEAWHGPLSRRDLDVLAPQTPVMVWHFSAHELYVNSAALAQMALPDTLPAGVNPAHIDRENGHFFETGAFFAAGALKHMMQRSSLFDQGMSRFMTAAHYGGITTMADMATGILTDVAHEATILQAAFATAGKPFRLLMTPDAKQLLGKLNNAQAVLEAVEQVSTTMRNERVFFGKQVKLFADGAFFSQRMQMEPPGYLDGHHGEWVMEPAEFRQLAEVFWRAGYQIHVHTNGDAGIEMVIATVTALQNTFPRIDHRFTIEHCGYATEDQIRRWGILGGLVSAQVYYVYALADRYATQALGVDRAARISPLGSLVRHRIPVSLHSDFPLAPLRPLLLAHIAQCRTTSGGNVVAPYERLSVDEALRAITIDAAYILRLEHSIGSIRAGKKADFTVLQENPYAPEQVHLDTIDVWGTIIDGVPYKKGTV